MKWPLRIFGSVLLLAALALFGAWFFFPWIAPALLKHSTSGKEIAVELQGAGRPSLSGLHFGLLKATVHTPPDSCTGIASTYRAKLRNGRLSWQLTGGKKPHLDLLLDADTVAVHMAPADIRFSQAKPRMRARIGFPAGNGILPDIAPDSISYRISNGRIASGQLRLEEASYEVLLTSADKWIQQPARFRARSLFSGTVKAPLSDFEATFGLAKKPNLPCTLFFRDCTVDLFGIRAYTPLVEYSLRNKRTAFDLKVDSVPLERFSGKQRVMTVRGKLSGSIPLEYTDSTIRIGNGHINAAKGTAITFRTDGTTLTFDAGTTPGAAPFVSNLNVRVSLDAADGALSAISLDSFSARLFEGRIDSTPARYKTASGTAAATIRIDRVPIPDRISIKGEFSGNLQGKLSGTIPARLDRRGIALRNAKLSVQGGGSIRQNPPKIKSEADQLFSAQSSSQMLWEFTNPSLIVNREATGRTTMGVALESVRRKASGGELLLKDPKGTLTMFADPRKPSRVTVSGFTAGILDGTVAVDRMDYDLLTKHAETRVQLNGIPIQTLLDLQGTKKLTATGSIRASIPFVLDNNTFSIPEGSMDAERNGLIIYASTPEERAASGAGMQLTYEALANFFYSELVSSIVMAPNGDSRISVKLKGHNPDFQNSRPVIINLNIEQNLLDLFRSLSISSEIEESLSREVQKRSEQKQK